MFQSSGRKVLQQMNQGQGDGDAQDFVVLGEIILDELVLCVALGAGRQNFVELRHQLLDDNRMDPRRGLDAQVGLIFDFLLVTVGQFWKFGRSKVGGWGILDDARLVLFNC